MKLHQALHGYVDGHRLLATSLELRPADAKTLLFFSDASGPSASIAPRGYLTGFSLPESGVYALCRTWAATDMPRPGCVWTHTLLIQLEDLASLDSPARLLEYFLRPLHTRSFSNYAIALDYMRAPLARFDSDDAMAAAILSGLYAQTAPVALMADLGDTEENLLLRIWGQQWPRLRRNFRFCTQVSADRSSEDSLFDLQLFSARRRIPPNWRVQTHVISDLTPYKTTSPTGWLKCALDDIRSSSGESLSLFLREVGLDIVGGRAAFKPLASIYAALTMHNADGVRQAYSIVQSEFANESAARLRDAVARGLLATLPQSATMLPTVLDHWNDLSAETREILLSAHLDEASKALANLGAPIVFQYLSEQDERNLLAAHAIRLLTQEALLEYLNDEPAAFADTLQHHPGLLSHPSLWRSSSKVRRVALNWIRANPSTVEVALPSLIKSDSGDFAEEISRQVSTEAILAVLLDNTKQQGKENFEFADSRWIDVATHNRDVVAKALVESRGYDRKCLIALAHAVPPDAVPNDYGDDPWITAVQSTEGTTSFDGDIYLRSYLFARGLGYRSRNQGELLLFSFHDLHSAALRSAIPKESWNLFKQRLPTSLFETWDRAESLRRAVVAAFVDRRLHTFSFLSLADDEVFAQLVNIAASTYYGRKYLKMVNANSESSVPTEKLAILNRAVFDDEY